MTNLKRDLTAVVKGLDTLSKKVDGLVATLAQTEKKPQVKKSKAAPKRVAKKVAPKRVAKKTATATPKVVKKVVKKAAPKIAAKKKKAPQTDSDKVFQVIKRYKKGADVPKIKARTGFNDKKISNIIHRAFKRGLIKRVGRGLYTAA